MPFSPLRADRVCLIGAGEDLRGFDATEAASAGAGGQSLGFDEPRFHQLRREDFHRVASPAFVRSRKEKEPVNDSRAQVTLYRLCPPFVIPQFGIALRYTAWSDDLDVVVSTADEFNGPRPPRPLPAICGLMLASTPISSKF